MWTVHQLITKQLIYLVLIFQLCENDPLYAFDIKLFSGQCQADGFYYNDQVSLVFCTNGYPYVQMCAKGSQNMDASQYQVGVDTYVSFCNVNLVDNGAGTT
jgi:hypothetical protein